MDLAPINRLRWTLSLHFAILAWLTAMLVATGTGTIFLPVFILLVGVAALIFVDGLQWFSIGRIGSYIGMLAATVFSVASYLYYAFSAPSESGQLLAIAGLLVYPEAVLFMQRKNLRIFEQLAIFLLLEMIVAALVNNNLLFGILLAPIMLFWVSSLFLFARYATLVYVNPKIEEQTPKMAEILLRKFLHRMVGEPQRVEVVSTQVIQSHDVRATRGLRRLLQSFPIGVGAVAFAGFFFYFLPRTTPATMSPPIGVQSRVGLPDSLSIGTVGRLLADPTPVMRVSLTHMNSGRVYQLREPPYLRARVMDVYAPSNRGRWRAYGEWTFGGMSDPRRLHGIETVESSMQHGRDVVNLEFDIKRQFARTMYTVPPIFASKRTEMKLAYDRFNMVLSEVDVTEMGRGKSLVYHIGSVGFGGGLQSPVIPANSSLQGFASNRNRYNLTRSFLGFQKANDYRLDLMDKTGVSDEEPLRFCQMLQSHFTDGGFTYTLDLSPPSDPELDPIEDFLINQRRGHCQYFASAMLILMRQSGIASRIVVGYRPVEFNSMGNYFPVRQSDAHAWVEGMFMREDLEGTPLERWLTDSETYWVRFDPTPSSDGGDIVITAQQGAAIDYADKLWKDYVVEGQKLSGENSLYKPVAETGQDAYNEMVQSLKNLRENLERGRLLSRGGGVGFAWPIAIAIIILGFLAIFVWRVVVMLPRVAPSLARRLGMLDDGDQYQQEFFARCMHLLARRGFQRKDFETPQEFTRAAAAQLAGSSSDPVDRALALLTDTYYRLRFGGEWQPTSHERQQLDSALHELELATEK